MTIFKKFFKNRNKEKFEQQTKNIKGKNFKKYNEKVASRKGELGEYKIDIQLDQLPKGYKYLSDIMVENPKSKSGYSQIDHVVINPFGIFVVETKNYQGTIYGGKNRKQWSVNGKFNMMNPFNQNHGHIEALKSLLDHKYKDFFISMVSFTKRCTIKVDLELRKIQSDQLIIYDVELSEYIHRKTLDLKRKYGKELITQEEINKIYDTVAKANITDETIRQRHIELLKQKNDSKTEADQEKNDVCVICKRPVSEKVKNFCLSNKKYKGKVYCFEHQKILKGNKYLTIAN
ncbi:MAG: NERD domain-containing protein [Bacillaceae bacterium]|nr:NERD domain-containing protein [Bacillaceae bacterium]